MSTAREETYMRYRIERRTGPRGRSYYDVIDTEIQVRGEPRVAARFLYAGNAAATLTEIEGASADKAGLVYHYGLWVKDSWSGWPVETEEGKGG